MLKIRSLALMLLVSLIVAAGGYGCKQTTPTQSTPVTSSTVKPTTTSSPTPSATVKPQPIKLRMNSVWSGPQFTNDQAVFFAAKMKELTNGRIDIEVFSDGQLGSAKDQHELVKQGAIDMCINAGPYLTGVTPLVGGYWLPLLWNYRTATDVLNAGVADLMGKQYETKLNSRTMGEAPGGVTLLVTTSKKVTTMDDLKGMLIRGAGGYLSDTVGALGATTVTISGAEVYTAYQRGTIDGSLWTVASYVPLKIWEVAKYVVSLPIAPGLVQFSINIDKFNSMPKDAQTAMLNAAAQIRPLLIERGVQYDAASLVTMKANGMVVTDLSPAETARWTTAMESVWVKFVKDNGADGQKVIDILKQYYGK